jgi:hypothetical protein
MGQVQEIEIVGNLTSNFAADLAGAYILFIRFPDLYTNSIDEFPLPSVGELTSKGVTEVSYDSGSIDSLNSFISYCRIA